VLALAARELQFELFPTDPVGNSVKVEEPRDVQRVAV